VTAVAFARAAQRLAAVRTLQLIAEFLQQRGARRFAHLREVDLPGVAGEATPAAGRDSPKFSPDSGRRAFSYGLPLTFPPRRVALAPDRGRFAPRARAVGPRSLRRREVEEDPVGAALPLAQRASREDLDAFVGSRVLAAERLPRPQADHIGQGLL